MSTQAIKRAEARRAAKEQAERNAKEQATKDAMRKPPAPDSPAALAHKARAAEAAAEAKEVPASSKVRKQLAKVAQQEAVQKQAEKDSLRKPAPVNLTPGRVGENPPLHLLNAIALQASADVLDEATAIAKEVGKVTRELVVGRTSFRGRGTRQQRRAEADARMQAAQKSE